MRKTNLQSTGAANQFGAIGIACKGAEYPVLGSRNIKRS